MSTDAPAPLWAGEQFLAAMDGVLDGPSLAAVSGLSMDSRSAAPGDAFFAIQGPNRDGHDFVAQALDAGATVAVVRREFQADGAAGALVRVDDPLAAMRRLAQAARERSRARIVAITGSVGKTGTKQALAGALARSGAIHASPASFNNHWGVPFSLATLPAAAEYAVFEMGMNHAGEIEPLSRLVRPHVAIITTIQPVHIGNLGSIEAIADAKAEIFAGVETGGSAVLNRDIDQFERLAAAAEQTGLEIVTFGESTAADVRLTRLIGHDSGSSVEADVMGTPLTYKIGAPGRHVAVNSLAVLAAVKLVGADLALAALAMADVAAAKGRGERRELAFLEGRLTLIDESYNANPASMRAALALLAAARPTGHGRRIAVLGDMLELGEGAERFHRDLAGPIAEAGVDLVFACGPHMRLLWDDLPPALRGEHAETAEALEQPLGNALRPGDVVMVKGSLGSRMGPLVAHVERLSDGVLPAPGPGSGP